MSRESFDRADCRVAARSPEEINSLVADGYDRIVESYRSWSETIRSDERDRYTSLIVESLNPGAQVLELGCGPASETTRKLAARFQLTAVDISRRNVEITREEVPAATVIHGDMTAIEFRPGQFEAIAAFYSLIHVPRTEQAGLIRSINSWLRPGGLFVASFGTSAVEHDYAGDWLGAPMYWSSYDRPNYRRIFEEAGLIVKRATIETAEEFGKPTSFLWFVSHKPVSREIEGSRA